MLMGERPEAADGRVAPDVALDVAPAYDLIESLCVLGGFSRPGRWKPWAREAAEALGDERRARVRAWFGREAPVGGACVALVPRLAGPRGPAELLAALAALPLGDFLRLAVTAGPTDPDTPLAAADLLALGGDATAARAFADRHLRLTGRARSHLLRILAGPEAARAELLDLLERHAAGAFAQVEGRARDERALAADRLAGLLAAAPEGAPEWLRKLRAVRGFAPVVVAPCAFVGDLSAYYHEIRRSLFDGAAYEPYLQLVGTRRVLDAPAAGRRREGPRPAAAEPAERWARLFEALADPSRARLVHLLAERPHYGQELAAALGVSGATVTHHADRLVRAGLVRVERRAHRTYFVLQAGALADALEGSRRYLLGRPGDGAPPADEGDRARGEEVAHG